MKDLKQTITQLIAADNLSEAVRYLLATEEGEALPDQQNDFVLLAGRLENWRTLSRQGTEDIGTITRMRNQISLAMLDISDDLPAGLPIPDLPALPRPEGISENTLKNRLLWCLLGAKLIVIGFVLTLWQSGSFTNEQFMATLGLLIPVFATYLTLMFKDRVSRRHALPHPDTYVTKSFQRTAIGLVIAYALTLLGVINLRGPGIISFVQMNTLLALVESGMGAYVGQVIFALFKK